MYYDQLYHYGVKGMKWGVRRYENADGSLTPAGQKRHAKQEARREKYLQKTQKKINNNKAYARAARNNINELKKNGVNSELVRERARENADWDVDMYVRDYEFNSGKQANRAITKLAKDANYSLGRNAYHQRAYNELMDENNRDVKRYTARAKQYTAANKAVMNMPAESNNREYRKAIRRAKKYTNV